MSFSILELFKIGIGPSSSHTVGPMVAAYRFVDELTEKKLMNGVESVTVQLYGALALTGKGHATDIACILGLSGFLPDTVDPDQVPIIIEKVRTQKQLNLKGVKSIAFIENDNLLFLGEHFLKKHPNAMKIEAFDHQKQLLHSNYYYSLGGGFVVSEAEAEAETDNTNTITQKEIVPYYFKKAEDLLRIGKKHHITFAQIAFANEQALGRCQDVEKALLNIWHVMDQCIQRGCKMTGILPGGLNVKRRANSMYKKLVEQKDTYQNDHLYVMDWVSMYALAVNEENAVGSRVVTAPTNGAAGVIPAVLAYYVNFHQNVTDQKICEFLATAALIGLLYKKNASISAAEVGCQGEIGVACSMAAAGLCAVMGGTNEQIANAAEIGMEHNLGLTCDPILGLVQIPCIERNSMGALKAINASRLALWGDGQQRVSLDAVIETMRQTGLDMQNKYKETAMGGLAVNITVC